MDILKVLVTVGSMVEKNFHRLLSTIDELCDENILDGNDVIAQIGFDSYEPRNFRFFDMISDQDFKKLIDDSDLIISHAGTGTVISCLKKRKKVIIFPRMLKYDEHYDNHQLELADLFTLKEYVLCAKNKIELVSCIEKLNSFIPRDFMSNNSKLNKLIIEMIESD